MEYDRIAIGIIFFILGNVTGFFLHKFVFKDVLNIDKEDRINFLIFAVTSIWVISVLVDILSTSYETSPLIHGIMGAIVGFFFWRPKR